MAIERTLSIIKPDAVAKNLIGVIDTRLENTGLRIVGAKMLHLAKQQASRVGGQSAAVKICDDFLATKRGKR